MLTSTALTISMATATAPGGVNACDGEANRKHAEQNLGDQGDVDLWEQRARGEDRRQHDQP